jgi:phosphoenolpyruvate carboxylase
MTKKEIKDLAKELIKEMGKADLELDVNLDEPNLEILATKIVAKLVDLRGIVNWYETSTYQNDYSFEMTEEEQLLSELAKCMTLMNMYTSKEEYEKCAVLRSRIIKIKRKLKKYDQ